MGRTNISVEYHTGTKAFDLESKNEEKFIRDIITKIHKKNFICAQDLFLLLFIFLSARGIYKDEKLITGSSGLSYKSSPKTTREAEFTPRLCEI